ncbi:MAG: serine hydrolase domain-containing protein [Rhodospirillaceae bacterium]
MRHARKFLCLAFLALAACDLRAASFGDAEKAKVDAIAEAWVKSGKSAGLVVGIASEGKMLHAKGFGFADLEHNIPMTPDAILRVGSINKQFTSAAMMQLAEAGKVSLEDPLAKYFPEFPRGKDVTIRQVLNHTSGMFNYTAHDMPDAAKWRQEYTTEEMVKRIATYEPAYDFEPGTAYRYSNSGYYVAGAIIEKVTGEKFADYLQKNVIAKAGLSADTAQDDDERLVLPRRAVGYEAAQDKPGTYLKGDFIDMSVPGAAGALRSTVTDLAAWHQALLTGKVVSAKSVAEMTAPGKLKDGKLSSTAIFRPTNAPPQQARRDPVPDYGLGLSTGTLSGRKMIVHTGGIQGFAAWLATFPDDRLTVVVLSNTDNGAAVARDIALAALGIVEAPQP